MSHVNESADTVAKACRILGKLDITHGALGHVSQRLDGDRMLIKSKGAKEVGLRYTQAKDVIEVDFGGNVLSAPEGMQAPSECFIHIALYMKEPALQSVIHVHPAEAVLLTTCGKPIVPFYGAYGPGAKLAVEGVVTYPRSVRIMTPELGEELATFMGHRKLCLMYGHGVTVVGSSVEDAVVRTIALNELLTMTYKAYLLGGPAPLSEDDLAALTEQRSPQQQRGSVGGEAGVMAVWRHYSRLTEEFE